MWKRCATAWASADRSRRAGPVADHPVRPRSTHPPVGGRSTLVVPPPFSALLDPRQTAASPLTLRADGVPDRRHPQEEKLTTK
jgi:hypothetical protein